MQNENRTAAKDCPVSGEDLFFAHCGTVQISGIIFAILPKGRHFHESDGNAGSTGSIHARTDTIFSYVYLG